MRGAADVAPLMGRPGRMNDVSARQEGTAPAEATSDVADAAARIALFRAALGAPLTATSAHERPVEQRPPGAVQGVTADSEQAASLASQSAGQGTAALHGGTLTEPSYASVLPAHTNTAATSLEHRRLAPTEVDSAPGPFAVHAGTVIPAVLVTEINSDLPGDVLAQVARDVFDSRTQQVVLIPKGSKLLGKYENQLGAGQERLRVAWTRVVFPDGRSVALAGLETKDAAGAGGLHDRVDRHGRRLFGTASLLSLVGAGAQLSQPNAGYGAAGSLGGYPSPGQVAAGAVGQELAQVATEMLRRNMDVQPTIRIRQGMPLNVFLTTDVAFAAPYAPHR